MAAETLKEAAEALYRWQHCRSDCFTDKLFDLLMKSDLNNRIRLQMGFPMEATALHEWQRAATPEEFYREYGIRDDRQVAANSGRV